MKNQTKNICVTAVYMALVFVITRFVQIPIPLGYFNVGNTMILLGCLMLPMPYGIFMGSVASALADLTSYPIYTVPTLVIKALLPLVFYLLMKLPVKKHFVKFVVAAAISTLIPLFGYTAVGAFIAGSLATGLSQMPGLALEYAANLALLCILYKPIIAINKRL
ncbi:MAG: ECF transporter S component [Lachnospiraceae bacterium]|nr:ECF transporter S component [Lachnospiraceae bacterium]